MTRCMNHCAGTREFPVRAYFAAFLCVLFANDPAWAQRPTAMLPQPISSLELARYAQKLGLSEGQQRNLETLHEQYKQDYKAIREGPP
jgi:hypothetical protein